MRPPHRRTPRRRLQQRMLGAAVLLTASVLLASCAASGQASQPNPDGTLTVRYEGAANTVTLPELAEDLGYLEGIKLEWVGNNTSGPSQIQNTATGATDIGSAFAGAVIKLREAGAQITSVVSSYGSDDEYFHGFYALEGSGISAPRDLIGKSVAVNTLGAHAEAVLGTYLRGNGLSEDEIAQVQLLVVPPSDIEQAVRTGQVDVGALVGPYQDHAIEQGGLQLLFSDLEYFGAFNAGQYVLREDFIAGNPQAARTLATGIGKAADWAAAHSREQVVARMEQIIDERGRGENTDALKYYKSYGVGKHAAIVPEDFSRWQQWLNDSGAVQGDITPSDYYTNEFNELTGEGKQER